MFQMNNITLNNPFSAPIFHTETTGSTMLDARTLAAKGAVHGTVISADVQELGRGRANRPWKDQRGQSLLFTILLRYPGIAAIPPALTLRTGLALSLAIEDFAPALKGLVQVKWPNDVMIGPRKAGPAKKVSGILTEGDGETVYIGIGVNVAQTDFPETLRRKATSIALALQDAADPASTAAPCAALPKPSPELPAQALAGELPADARFRLLEAFLGRFHRELGGGDDWRERLDARLYMRDRRVRFIVGGVDSGQAVEGLLRGIGPGGEILIQPENAAEARAFLTGELDVY
jgi:BirA family biotin operon repressor/biotin-[acetyl-CoA-carboxylase] ligase